MSPGTEIILVFVKMSILAKVSTLAIQDFIAENQIF